MRAIEIENAHVTQVADEQVKMNDGTWRAKQVVEFTENTSDGVRLHGCVVWDDNIGKLNLQAGNDYKLTCKLVGRQWGGRFNYELYAFRAEMLVKVEKTQTKTTEDF